MASGFEAAVACSIFNRVWASCNGLRPYWSREHTSVPKIVFILKEIARKKSYYLWNDENPITIIENIFPQEKLLMGMKVAHKNFSVITKFQKKAQSW
jgi:hypothetical protein